MDKNKIRITVLGAGISGLATAYQLSKEGFDVTVLEEKSAPGGSMVTGQKNGFPIDYGPNSGLETTPMIAQIASETGLEEDMIYANEEGNKRYILKNSKLHALPTNPIAFLKTQLFSPKAKLRLLAEPFIGKSKEGYYQSISQFVKRRLGQEFLDYAINPFVAGVFAGDPDTLSVKSAFPKLYRLEELYGGLIKGVIKGAKERKQRREQSKQSAKMFSFTGGMQTFPMAIAGKLGNRVKYNCTVEKIEQSDKKYKILFKHNGESEETISHIVLSTIPAYKAALVFGDQDDQLRRHLNDIYYPPVKVLYIGFKKEDVGQALDGFGFLIPAKEKKSFLGAIWSSVIFPQRADDRHAAFTMFIGGARSPEIFDEYGDGLTDRVLKEFKYVMKINQDPSFVDEKMWEKAIPQYNLGYIEHEKYFEKFEKQNPGMFLSGNYRGGISVGDCIINSEVVCKRIVDFTA
jgi:oxygen-dependent protoporphyrinogen oxidase